MSESLKERKFYFHSELKEQLNNQDFSSSVLKKVNKILETLQCYREVNVKRLSHVNVNWFRGVISGSSYYLMWTIDESHSEYSSYYFRKLIKHPEGKQDSDVYKNLKVDHKSNYSEEVYTPEHNHMQLEVATNDSEVIINFASAGTGKTQALLETYMLDSKNRETLYLTQSFLLCEHAELLMEYRDKKNAKNKFKAETINAFWQKLSNDQYVLDNDFEKSKRLFIKDVITAKFVSSRLDAATFYDYFYGEALGKILPPCWENNKTDSAVKISDAIEQTDLIFGNLDNLKQLKSFSYFNPKEQQVLEKIGRFIFNPSSKVNRIKKYFPRQARAYSTLRDKFFIREEREERGLKKTYYIPQVEFDLFSDRRLILIDEVQDLTHIELFVLLYGAFEFNRRNDQSRMRLVLSGDVGQTIFPTNFEVSTLKTFLRSLGFKKENIYETDQNQGGTYERGRKEIPQIISHLDNLYSNVPKELKKNIDYMNSRYEISEDEVQEYKMKPAYLMQLEGEGELHELKNELKRIKTEIPASNFKIVNWNYMSAIDKEFKNIETNVYLFKGMDTGIVVAPGINKFLEAIFSNNGDHFHKLKSKVFINNLKVAVSRAKRSVVFVDTTSGSKSLENFDKIATDLNKITKKELLGHIRRVYSDYDPLLAAERAFNEFIECWGAGDTEGAFAYLDSFLGIYEQIPESERSDGAKRRIYHFLLTPSYKDLYVPENHRVIIKKFSSLLPELDSSVTALKYCAVGEDIDLLLENDFSQIKQNTFDELIFKKNIERYYNEEKLEKFSFKFTDSKHFRNYLSNIKHHFEDEGLQNAFSVLFSVLKREKRLKLADYVHFLFSAQDLFEANSILHTDLKDVCSSFVKRDLKTFENKVDAVTFIKILDNSCYKENLTKEMLANIVIKYSNNPDVQAFKTSLLTGTNRDYNYSDPILGMLSQINLDLALERSIDIPKEYIEQVTIFQNKYKPDFYILLSENIEGEDIFINHLGKIFPEDDVVNRLIDFEDAQEVGLNSVLLTHEQIRRYKQNTEHIEATRKKRREQSKAYAMQAGLVSSQMGSDFDYITGTISIYKANDQHWFEEFDFSLDNEEHTFIVKSIAAKLSDFATVEYIDHCKMDTNVFHYSTDDFVERLKEIFVNVEFDLIEVEDQEEA